MVGGWVVGLIVLDRGGGLLGGLVGMTEPLHSGGGVQGLVCLLGFDADDGCGAGVDPHPEGDVEDEIVVEWDLCPAEVSACW